MASPGLSHQELLPTPPTPLTVRQRPLPDGCKHPSELPLYVNRTSPEALRPPISRYVNAHNTLC